jgi:hypothetical protein
MSISRRASMRSRLARLTLLATLAACLDSEEAAGPDATPTQLSPFDVAVTVSPETITRGETGFISVWLRNPTDSTIRVTSRDGCPVFEPVVRHVATPEYLLPFVRGGCFSPTGTTDSTRLTLSIAPRDTVSFRFAFAGAILPVTLAGATITCMPAGSFNVLVLSPTDEAGELGIVTAGPAFPRNTATTFGMLREPPDAEGPPPCTA